MKKGIFLYLFLYLFDKFFITISYAAGIESSIENYIPKIYLEGLTGSSLLGQVDILFPVYLVNDEIFFMYAHGRISDNQSQNDTYLTSTPWTGGIGLGYRYIVTNKTLLGAYILTDFSNITEGHKCWDIGPGVEILGNVWDFHINGYFPISKKSWASEGWQNNLDIMKAYDTMFTKKGILSFLYPMSK